jgi:hypothetical protein
MTAAVRGSHHCVGIATAVTDMIFQHLRSLCEGRGGVLSADDLLTAQSQVMRSFAGAPAFFDATHARCMAASAATAPAPFTRETILASLLFVCGQKAARPAFSSQITRFGEVWLGQFFGGTAEYVRRAICPTADDRLRGAYSVLSGKLGARLGVNDLMGDPDVRTILKECASPLCLPEAPDVLAAPMSDVVSQHIAEARGIPKPDLSKVTEQEMRKFLGWLPRHMHIALTATGGSPTAASTARQAATAGR